MRVLTRARHGIALLLPPCCMLWLTAVVVLCLCVFQQNVSKLGVLMSDMSGRRMVLSVVAVVFALSLIEAATLSRTSNQLPQVGLDTLHAMANDGSVSEGFFRDFLRSYVSSAEVLHMGVCSGPGSESCVRCGVFQCAVSWVVC